MSRIVRLLSLTLVLVLAVSFSVEGRIKRVSRRWNVMSAYGGYSSPIGSYDRVGVIDFLNSVDIPVEVDADRVYENTYQVGINYGQLRNGHLFYSFGFRYTKVSTPDTFIVDPFMSFTFVPLNSSLNQYDLDMNINYLLTNIATAPIAPYVGLGLHGGFTSQTAPGFESENWLTLAASANFGADFKLFTAANGRDFMTLSSVNSINLLASSQRPRYLNFGLALKYYFRQ